MHFSIKNTLSAVNNDKEDDGICHIQQRRQPHGVEFSYMAGPASDLPPEMFSHSLRVFQIIYYYYFWLCSYSNSINNSTPLSGEGVAVNGARNAAKTRPCSASVTSGIIAN